MLEKNILKGELYVVCDNTNSGERRDRDRGGPKGASCDCTEHISVK
jgi:hypothetical protein